MPGVGYTLTDRALHTLLACEDSDVRRLLSVMEQLGFDSGLRGVFTGSERKGRPVHAFVAGEFVIFYVRSPRRPLHVVDVLKV